VPQRRRTVSGALGRAATVGALAAFGAGCGSSGSEQPRQPEQVTTSLAAAAPVLEACALVDRAAASAIAGVQLERRPAPANELAASTCYLVTPEPADPAEGYVLRQVQVTVYDGAEFFDDDGEAYPGAERTALDIGDEAFVHVADGLRGVTVEVRVGSAVYVVNYVESAVLTDEPVAAASKRAALVELIAARVAG
jgi:hypothetical protein